MIELTDEQWARIKTILPRIRALRAEIIKARQLNLTALTKAQLIEVITRLTTR